MSTRMICAALAAVTCVAAVAQTPSGAQGSALSDPTRPPSVTAGPAGAQDEVPAGRQLQSVLLSRGRKLAIIDGATVPLGGMVGDARLVKIGETEVTLQNGDETEVLKLYPAVDKQPVKRAPSRTRDAAAPGSSGQGGSK